MVEWLCMELGIGMVMGLNLGEPKFDSLFANN